MIFSATKISSNIGSLVFRFTAGQLDEPPIMRYLG
jgi:hypothetical protein